MTRTLALAVSRRSRAPSGRKVAGAPAARGSRCPTSEMRAAAAERAARRSARWGRAPWRGQHSRPCPSPPPPRPAPLGEETPGWSGKMDASCGQALPRPARSTGQPWATPPPLPGLCSPPRGRGSQPQQLGSPFPTRGTPFDRGWEFWTPLVKSRVGCLHYRKGCDSEMLDPSRKTGA